MVSITSFFLFCLSSLTILFIARAQDRAPHGLVYEKPVAFSPSAVEFFHPKTQPNAENPCAASSSCSPFPLAAQLGDTDQTQGKISTSPRGGKQLGAGGIAGVVLEDEDPVRYNYTLTGQHRRGLAGNPAGETPNTSRAVECKSAELR
ncbi:hypothetical protein POTOM_018115 [Populus tomentosa]|uniref:Uncharacterized protein n=1 Tax=Populus tomentosa TaxID=118781 RepID=A0A8X7ZYM1_POPTO|nr:hypothetical protein POTOM_018115 [Populus tomentosa]